MYGLPNDIDLGFFNDRTLVQVCFGAHDVIFNFDGDVSIVVTSSIGCADASGNVHRNDDFREIAPSVLGLLNQRISSAAGDDAGTLTMRYANGATVCVYDDSKDYESYTIKNGEQVIVV